MTNVCIVTTAEHGIIISPNLSIKDVFVPSVI